MAFAPSGENPDAFCQELQQVSSVPFSSASPEPEGEINLSAARRAIRTALDPLKLPSDAVVMIGTRDAEKQWAAAGKIARFIPASDYYGAAPN